MTTTYVMATTYENGKTEVVFKKIEKKKKTKGVINENYCHADMDGDCCWKGCPQIRDGEPKKVDGTAL